MMIRFLVLLAAFLFSASGATATIKPGDGLLMFNGGLATGKGAVTGATFDGPVVSLSYEKLDWTRPVSFGFNFSWSQISRTETVESQKLTRHVETWPIYLGGKYFAGQGPIQAYVGASIGVYFSTVETSVAQTGEEYARWSASGWGLGVPVGVTLSLGNTLFANVNYMLNWMWSNEAFDNDLTIGHNDLIYRSYDL
jgi:hypothetical protein